MYTVCMIDPALTGFLTKPMVDVMAIPSLSKASCDQARHGEGREVRTTDRTAGKEVQVVCRAGVGSVSLCVMMVCHNLTVKVLPVSRECVAV